MAFSLLTVEDAKKVYAYLMAAFSEAQWSNSFVRKHVVLAFSAPAHAKNLLNAKALHVYTNLLGGLNTPEQLELFAEDDV